MTKQAMGGANQAHCLQGDYRGNTGGLHGDYRGHGRRWRRDPGLLRSWPLFIGHFVLLFLRELKVFLVGIALFARFALFVGYDAALVLTFLAVSGGLLTASELLRGVIGSHSGAGEKGG
jgi:hypothetical protein